MKINRFSAVAPLLVLLLGASRARASALEDGKDFEASGDFEQAAESYFAASAEGDAEAQYRLAGLYMNGKGVAKDPAAALKLYRKAADKGEEHAQFDLGALCANGQGMPRDYAQAAKWWTKAAEAGLAPAQYQLGVIFETGRGAARSPVDAYKWYWLATEQGQDTGGALERVRGAMTPKQLSSAQWLAEQAHDRIEAAKASRKAARELRAQAAAQASAKPRPARVAEPPAAAPPEAPAHPSQAASPQETPPSLPVPVVTPAVDARAGVPVAPPVVEAPAVRAPLEVVEVRSAGAKHLPFAAGLLALGFPFLFLIYRLLRPAKKSAVRSSSVVLAPKESGPKVKASSESEEDRKALEELLRRPKSLMAKDHYAAALRLCLRLGEFERAAALFVDLQKTFPVGMAPELYYYFALLSEKSGELQRARDIYAMILGRFPGYKDVDRRARLLDGIPAEEARLLTATLARRGSSSAQVDPETLIAGKFDLREPLGVGGMGVVYKGFDRALSREVAVKKMLAETAADEDACARFIEEARVVAALNHPYIVSIYDIVKAGGQVYLVFEYVNGETLLELISGRGKFAPAECVRILRFVAEALAFAHENGVVHRDLKPANIMMTKKGYLKVMDFGLARKGARGAGAMEEAEDVGTPAYMAPEQHRGRVSAQSDVFAFGVTAYEMLTGELPFDGKDLYGQKATGAYKPLPDSIPKDLRDFVSRCLQSDPAARPVKLVHSLEKLNLAT